MKLNIFHKKPKYKLLQGHQVIESFEYKGVKYFELQDILEIPCQRAFAIRDYFEELQMRCTREFLQAHCTAVTNILSNPKTLNIPELAKLNMQLQERLDLIIDAEIVYKLASVYYFDESENPYIYNYKYGLNKITKWKEGNDELSFFLLEPVKKLANLSVLLEGDLANYLNVVKKITQKHLADIFTNLSESDKKKDFAQILTSQMQQE
jgi:hypothetical protein